jgi:hypothetical protein
VQRYFLEICVREFARQDQSRQFDAGHTYRPVTSLSGGEEETEASKGIQYLSNDQEACKKFAQRRYRISELGM